MLSKRSFKISYCSFIYSNSRACIISFGDLKKVNNKIANKKATPRKERNTKTKRNNAFDLEVFITSRSCVNGLLLYCFCVAIYPFDYVINNDSSQNIAQK